ncbi:unnamed protein product [Ambrosiozyma monospora]|uniref:Unnamed protein product n=1 Tax=Ambrosiozyma monospora TaxID=43982 RepID=A0ACB5U1L9_AMBMO|nr:unnamed protein product [Ambrosiozyma monospora]
MYPISRQPSISNSINSIGGKSPEFLPVSSTMPPMTPLNLSMPDISGSVSGSGSVGSSPEFLAKSGSPELRASHGGHHGHGHGHGLVMGHGHAVGHGRGHGLGVVLLEEDEEDSDDEDEGVFVGSH